MTITGSEACAGEPMNAVKTATSKDGNTGVAGRSEFIRYLFLAGARPAFHRKLNRVADVQIRRHREHNRSLNTHCQFLMPPLPGQVHAPVRSDCVVAHRGRHMLASCGCGVAAGSRCGVGPRVCSECQGLATAKRCRILLAGTFGWVRVSESGIGRPEWPKAWCLISVLLPRATRNPAQRVAQES